MVFEQHQLFITLCSIYQRCLHRLCHVCPTHTALQCLEALRRRPAQRYWITFRLQFRAAQRSFLKNSAAQLCFSINTACTNIRDRGRAIINENILASFLEYPKLLQHVASPLHNYHPQKPLASYSFIVILLYGVITL